MCLRGKSGGQFGTKSKKSKHTTMVHLGKGGGGRKFVVAILNLGGTSRKNGKRKSFRTPNKRAKTSQKTQPWMELAGAGEGGKMGGGGEKKL